MLTNDQLHAATITLLAPITRDHYTYAGDTATHVDRVNPTGLDLHDGHVGPVAKAPDGTAAPYIALATHPRGDRHTRLTGGTSMGTYTVSLTVAAGTPRGLRGALDRVMPLLARAYLIPGRTGLLRPYFDTVDVIEDEDVTPTRWYAPLRYRTTVH